MFDSGLAPLRFLAVPKLAQASTGILVEDINRRSTFSRRSRLFAFSFSALDIVGSWDFHLEEDQTNSASLIQTHLECRGRGAWAF